MNHPDDLLLELNNLKAKLTQWDSKYIQFVEDDIDDAITHLTSNIEAA